MIPCRCGERHHPDDSRLGCAVDPDTYDYVGAVLWQAHAGALWARFTTILRRALAAELGVTARDFRDHARLSYAKVAEYQRRGLVHFHAVVRLDGPEGPADPCPVGLDQATLREAITRAAAAATLTITRPDGTPMALGWGTQLDLRPVTPSAAAQIETERGKMTDTALAGYIAKYATKGTGATNGADRPIRDVEHIAYLDISPHHRTMIETAWRLREDLAALDRATDDPGTYPIDLDTVLMINDWVPVRFGHRDDAERELAGAIAERNRQHRRTTTTRRTP